MVEEPQATAEEDSIAAEPSSKKARIEPVDVHQQSGSTENVLQIDKDDNTVSSETLLHIIQSVQNSPLLQKARKTPPKRLSAQTYKTFQA